MLLLLLASLLAAASARVKQPLTRHITDHEKLHIDSLDLHAQHRRIRSANGFGELKGGPTSALMKQHDIHWNERQINIPSF